ncbi:MULTISPECIES: S1 RNA-binding domain-containing protein [Streptomyces]|uniref:S1 RNA-binding domain-containing protein n=1 Tax=Streptomyces TaxID=1883 RepID=UPI0012FEAB6C|nr:S1 RNA-binding domain-containing protein [Streptomyces griseolus]
MTYPLPSKALRDFLVPLCPGDVVAGLVTRIENFGVFVDLDGAPEASVGFIPPPELSWRWLSFCHEAVSLGQRVSAEVLALDTERRGQAVLSLIALQENPWLVWAERVGSVVSGRVTKLVPFGAFIGLDDGIAGLIHNSELLAAAPGGEVRVGDVMTVRIAEVDPPMRRIRLSPGR